MKYALKSVGLQVIILEKAKKDLISIVCTTKWTTDHKHECAIYMFY